MQRSWINVHGLRMDWWQKVTESILAAVILYLSRILLTLAIRPLEMLYGTSGLLVFTLALMAAAMISLQLSLNVHYSDYIRAWYGIAAGFFAWSVIDASTFMGIPIPVPAGFVPLIMVSLIVFLLWRSHLPIGARYFSLAFLLNWTAFLLLTFQAGLAVYSPVFSLIFHATGVAALLLSVIVFFWIMFQSYRRIQRAGGALLLFFLGIIIVYVFRGPVF